LRAGRCATVSNIIVITIAAVVVGSYVSSADWLTRAIEEIPNSFRTLNSGPLIAALLLWIPLSLVAVAFFTKVFSYLQHYLGGEIANRSVLFACEEAVNLLESKGAAYGETLQFHEKRSIVERLGCTLVPWRNGSRPRNAVFPPIRDHDGDAWILISPQEKRKNIIESLVD